MKNNSISIALLLIAFIFSGTPVATADATPWKSIPKKTYKKPKVNPKKLAKNQKVYTPKEVPDVGKVTGKPYDAPPKVVDVPNIKAMLEEADLVESEEEEKEEKESEKKES